MVKGHCLQLRCHPPLSKTSNGLTLGYPVIWKEVDGVSAKSAIEPYGGGAGFYSNVLVVPKHTGGL